MFTEFIKFYLVWTLLTIISFSPIIFYLIIKRMFEKIRKEKFRRQLETQTQKQKAEFIENIYSFFNLDEVWQLLLFIIDAFAIIVFLVGMFIFPIVYHDSVKTMKNNHQDVLKYESNLNPTKSVCDKAEKYNEELKELDFADSVEEQKEYIDTELLWARFLNNTNARAESIIKE